MRIQNILFLSLFFFGSVGNSEITAQQHNGEIFSDLLQDHLLHIDTSLKEVKGNWAVDYLPGISFDTLSGIGLQLGDPIISYKKISSKSRHYQRLLSFSSTLSTKPPETQMITFTDTLELNEIKEVIKKSPKELKGDKPTIMSKWIRPALLISLSTTVIIALFFVRSS